MTLNISSFRNFVLLCSRPLSNPRLPNGTTVPTTKCGSIKLSSSLTLDNALLVPHFSFNLLSISKLTEDLNCAAIFFPSFCVFQDLSTKKLIGKGEVRNGLYHHKYINGHSSLSSGNERC